MAIGESGPRAPVERELTSPVALCDGRGRLRPEAVGWSRHPLHTCNLSGHAPRKKRWNYWCLNSDRILFSATVADVDHYVLAFVYFFEFESRRFIEKTAILPPGSLSLPDTVAGDIAFGQAGRRVVLSEDGDGTRIEVDWPRFGDVTLQADLRVERPAGHETTNVVIPWSRERFQFTSKQNCLPVTGTIALGDEQFRLDAGDAFACLDFGRGVWKYRTAWNWASCSTTLSDGRALGLNLGGRWTDGTGMTENAIVLDGRISKLSEDVRFDYDSHDFMRPWRITSVPTPTQRSRGASAPPPRIDLRFVPFHERVASAKTGVLMSEVHQMFGHYDGCVVADDGEQVVLDGVFGWIEEHKARW